MNSVIHGHHHIARGWRKERYVLRVVLAGGLPAAFLLVAGLYVGLPFASIFSSLAVSLARLFAAYGISLVAAVCVAVAVGSRRAGGQTWMAVFDVMQNVPSFALLPLFVAVFGLSSGMIVAFAVTSIVWPILFSVLQAIHTERQSLDDAATIFGARGFARVAHYLVPLSYPAIITGSIVGVSIGWEAVIGGEIIGSIPGIGSFLNAASEGGQPALFVAGLSALLIAVFIVNRLVWSPLLKKTYAYAE
jgi:ABC-type nitrate/sulfonate/bicarbonate transport system permease component